MKIFLKVLFVLLTLIAVYASISPSVQMDDFDGEDKLAHVCFYFSMTVLGLYAFEWYAVLWIVGISSVLEFIQRFVPTRDFNLLDLLFNILGITTASLIVFLIRTKRKKNQELSR